MTLVKLFNSVILRDIFFLTKMLRRKLYELSGIILLFVFLNASYSFFFVTLRLCEIIFSRQDAKTHKYMNYLRSFYYSFLLIPAIHFFFATLRLCEIFFFLEFVQDFQHCEFKVKTKIIIFDTNRRIYIFT